MNNGFSKEKFMTLSLESRHKKASAAIKLLYDNLLQGSIDPKILAYYKALESYLDWPAVELTFQSLSDRFHKHASLALLDFKEHNLLAQITKYDSPSQNPFLPVDIYLDNIRSAHNVGSIIRTTEALRLGSVFFSKQMVTTSCKKLQDTAMGTLDKVTIEILEDLQQLKSPRIAIETSQDAFCLHEFVFPKSFSLMFGNEEYGLSQQALQMADYIVKIPLHGFKNSLNVACAFSMIASEIRRQHAYNTHL
jgi:tRNA G18 (ribose-2'-O)-methylase SpoU